MTTIEIIFSKRSFLATIPFWFYQRFEMSFISFHLIQKPFSVSPLRFRILRNIFVFLERYANTFILARVVMTYSYMTIKKQLFVEVMYSISFNIIICV